MDDKAGTEITATISSLNGKTVSKVLQIRDIYSEKLVIEFTDGTEFVFSVFGVGYCEDMDSDIEQYPKGTIPRPWNN